MGNITTLGMRPAAIATSTTPATAAEEPVQKPTAPTVKPMPAAAKPVAGAARPMIAPAAKPTPPAAANYRRAAVELAIAWGTEYTIYWSDFNANSPDRDHPMAATSALKKLFLFPGMRSFDTNPLFGNIWEHPGSAALWHGAMRENDVSYLKSQIMTCAMSHAGESIGELPEADSLNDEANTCLPGASIGESVYQFHRFLRSNGYRLNQLSDNWHRFDASLGVGVKTDMTGPARPIGQLSLSAEVMNDPLYGKPGAIDKWYTNGLGAEAQLQISTSRGGGEGLHFLTKALPVGHVAQRLSRDAAGTLSGYTSFLGYGNGYEVDYNSSRSGAETDHIAQVNQGVTAKGTLYTHGAALSWDADVAADFAQLDPYAYDKWKETNSTADIMTVLARQHYYYAFGGTARLKLDADFARLSVSAHAQADRYNAITSYDRFPGTATRDLSSMHDSRVAAGATISYPVAGNRLTLDANWQRRDGVMPGTEVSGDVKTLVLSYGIRL